MKSELISALESLLLVIDEPSGIDVFARATGAGPDEVREALTTIKQDFDQRGSGFDLREHNGLWRLYTRRENSDIVEAYALDGAQSRLSRAALETLAVVAYRQPVTRAQVAAVRGVNVDGVMRTLTLRGLVSEVETGEDSGSAHQYATTDLFLEVLGIESLEDLPDLAPLLPDMDSIDSIEDDL